MRSCRSLMLALALALGIAGPASALNISQVEMTGAVDFSGIPFSFVNPGNVSLTAFAVIGAWVDMRKSISEDVDVPATISWVEPTSAASATAAFDVLSSSVETMSWNTHGYAGVSRTHPDGLIVADETGALTITLDYTVMIHLESDPPPPLGGRNTVCGSGHASIYLPFQPPQHSTITNVGECVQDGASLDRTESGRLELTRDFMAGDLVDFVFTIQPEATVDRFIVPEPDPGWALGLFPLGVLALRARRPFRP